MQSYPSSLRIIEKLAPDLPIAANRPHAVRRAAKWFVENFNGDILYAVKANPSPWVLDELWQSGVRSFDVASIKEIELVHSRFPQATLAFMHPVKNRNAISRAYFDFGVRIFALDSIEELEKILEATENAKDLTLMVRLSVSNSASSIKLDGKFGIKGDDAIELLRASRSVTREDLGICFHVGSQCMDPRAYADAMDLAATTIRKAGVVIDIIDVGGGFPVNYRDMTPPPMAQYLELIARKFENMPVTENCALWCEPGRAMVAEATSIIARVELVKGNFVYLNDGAYGNLFDATHVNWPFETNVLRAFGEASAELKPYRVFGPTCDGIDELNNEYYLPVDIKEGDYIEFQMLGAYGIAMATGFNGFGETLEFVTLDNSHISMFETEENAPISFERYLAE